MKQNFKLTKDQQTLVEKNLSIVHWVIVNNIHVNPGICGLEYGDLFQEGCLWLCKAAFTYNAGQAQFSTYAKKVVKNGLLSYCRKICSQGRHVSRLIIGEQGELAADGEQVDQPDDHFDSHLSRLETLDLLEASKQNYQGVARLGIEALALKVQGIRVRICQKNSISQWKQGGKEHRNKYQRLAFQFQKFTFNQFKQFPRLPSHA